MPGVGGEDTAPAFPAHPMGDLVEQFLDKDGDTCSPKRELTGYCRLFYPFKGVPDDSGTCEHEHHRDQERPDSFETSVAVGVALVTGLP